MPEKELLGQGIVELLLESSKLKPALQQAKQLIESYLGGSGGMKGTNAGGAVFKDMATQAKVAGRKAKSAIEDELSKVKAVSGAKDTLLKHLGEQAETATDEVVRLRDEMGRFQKRASGTGAAARQVGMIGLAFRGVGASARATTRGIVGGVSIARRSITGLTRSVRGLGGAFRATKTAGLGFGGMLAAVAGGNVLANVIMKITGRIRGMVRQGWQSAAMMETMKISFEKLVGSKKGADALLESLTELANQTPLDNQQIIQGATSLMATKKIANDQLIPTLEKLADTAAGSSEGFAAFPRVVRAVGQMLTKGKVSAEEMMQLAEAGVPAWQALADSMGKSQSEVMALSSQGKLGVEAIQKLIQGLGKQYEGLAEKQSKTWSGLMSTVKGVGMGIMRDILKPVMELGKVNLSNLIDWMQSDRAKAFFETIKKAVATVVNLIDKGLKSPLVRTIAIVGGMAVAFTGMAAAAMAAGGMIMSILNPVVLVVGGIAAGVAALGLSFKKALASKQGKEIIDTLGEMKALVIEIGLNLRDGLLSVWESIKSLMGSIFKMDTGSFWLKVVKGAHSFLDVISLMTSDWQATWDLMKASAARQLLIVYDKAMWVWEAIKGGFAVMVGGLVGLFKAWVSQMKAFFIEVGNLAAATGSGISAVFRKIWENPTQLFNPSALATAFAEEFQKKLASQKQPDYLNYGDAMKAEADKWGSSVRAMSDQARKERAAAIGETEREMQDALDRMEKSRAKKRADRAAAKKPEEEKAAVEEEEEVAKSMDNLSETIKNNADKYSKTSIEGLHDAVQDSLMGKSDPLLDESKKQTGIQEDIRDKMPGDTREKLSDMYAKGEIGMDEFRERWEKLGKDNKPAKSAADEAKAIAEGAAKGVMSPMMEAAKKAAEARDRSADIRPGNLVGGDGAALESRERIAQRQQEKDAAAAESSARIDQLKQQAEEAAMAAKAETRARMMEQWQQQAAGQMDSHERIKAFQQLKNAPLSPADDARKALAIQQQILLELKKQTGTSDQIVAATERTGDKVLSNMGFGE